MQDQLALIDQDLPEAICQTSGWGLYDAHFHDPHSSVSKRSYLLIYDPEVEPISDDSIALIEKFQDQCVELIDELAEISVIEQAPPVLMLKLNHDGFLPSEAMYHRTVTRLLTLLNLNFQH